MADSQEFLAELAGVLEVPSIAPEADFRTTPLWGSLTCFALKVMLMQRFGVDLTLQELADTATVADLMKRVLG